MRVAGWGEWVCGLGVVSVLGKGCNCRARAASRRHESPDRVAHAVPRTITPTNTPTDTTTRSRAGHDLKLANYLLLALAAFQLPWAWYLALPPRR